MGDALGGTEVHDLWSDAVGDTFRVFVGHCAPDPRAVLFVTDANGLFGLAVDTVRLMQIPGLVPPLLVVGVGYPDAEAVIDTVEVRARDFTPTPSSRFPGSGGADAFIDFISNELRPWLADRFPKAAGDVTYFGHSLGGLFGTYTLLSATATFDRYICSSPSLWWDNEAIFTIDNERPDAARLNSRVFYGIGSLETDAGRRTEAKHLADGHPAKPPAMVLDMVDDLRRFIDQLGRRNDPTLRIDSVEIDDEFHATVPAIVLNRALRRFHSESPSDAST